MRIEDFLTKDFKDIYNECLETYEVHCCDSLENDLSLGYFFAFDFKGMEFSFEIHIYNGDLSLQCVFINNVIPDEEIGEKIHTFLEV